VDEHLTGALHAADGAAVRRRRAAAVVNRRPGGPGWGWGGAGTGPAVPRRTPPPRRLRVPRRRSAPRAGGAAQKTLRGIRRAMGRAAVRRRLPAGGGDVGRRRIPAGATASPPPRRLLRCRRAGYSRWGASPQRLCTQSSLGHVLFLQIGWASEQERAGEQVSEREQGCASGSKDANELEAGVVRRPQPNSAGGPGRPGWAGQRSGHSARPGLGD
jgi:hypothetical protein